MKVARGCHKCGEKRCGALEWHHKDPNDKLVCISDAISQDWSWVRIQLELDKCEVICKNCHAVEHSIYRTDGQRKRKRKV